MTSLNEQVPVSQEPTRSPDRVERDFTEILVKGQNEILEGIVKNAPLSEVLTRICMLVEELSQADAVASIMLLDQEGRLHTAAAPQLPEDYLKAIDGIQIAPNLGTCAAAASRGEDVITPDLASAPSWEGLRELPLGIGLQAAWSRPIFSSQGEVLGTLGTYFRTPRKPKERERRTVEVLAKTAGIAIEGRRTERALRESEARFRALFQLAGIGMAQISPDGKILQINDRFCENLQYSCEQLRQMSLADITHPSDMSQTLKYVELLKSGSVSSTRYDKQFVRADGSVFWGAVTSTMVRDEQGESQYLIGTIQDITDRKKAEEHRNRLVAELNHRVKNSLAIVSATARQTIRYSDSLNQFKDSFFERLQSFTQAHDLLTRTDWEGIFLHELIQAEFRHFISRDEQLELTGPSLFLLPKAALSFHMILHELCTNAAKYGALASQGKVKIDWQIEATSEGQEFFLRWEEQDGPPVQPPQRQGFGTEVLQATVSHELHGEIHLHYHKEGVCCELHFPWNPELIEHRPSISSESSS